MYFFNRQVPGEDEAEPFAVWSYGPLRGEKNVGYGCCGFGGKGEPIDDIDR